LITKDGTNTLNVGPFFIRRLILFKREVIPDYFRSVTIQEVYDITLSIEEHMVTKEEIKPFIDTIEIISNPAAMQTLIKNQDDIRDGRIQENHGL
jgi:hypothetical protein